jgi:Arc/MetJ-type ribon-helix-helix transcriptional regulator
MSHLNDSGVLMATTTITLSQDVAAKLDGLVAEGRYASVDDALAHSLDLLLGEANIPSDVTAAAHARIQQGIDASLRGETITHQEIEALFADWQRELRA